MEVWATAFRRLHFLDALLTHRTEGDNQCTHRTEEAESHRILHMEEASECLRHTQNRGEELVRAQT
jgi:hypothetical protein